MSVRVLLALVGLQLAVAAYVSEYVELPGHKIKNDFKLPRPHEYTNPEDLPASFNWNNVDGKSYLTKNLNQHIPQYCGSCWAHAAMSSLADRIKIARGGKGIDINLAIQFILNCGAEVGGTCHGGSQTGAWEFIKRTGYVPYDTCLQYTACSSDSDEGICGARDYTCSPINTCRTCSTFISAGGVCAPLAIFPNATVSEYGTLPISAPAIKAEVFRRGPIACSLNASPLHTYHGGVYNDTTQSHETNHVVSIVGWGVEGTQEYWIVRNSWGEYWGEMGFFRIALGQNQLGIESSCAWATPGSWTEVNYPCDEDGGNCQDGVGLTTRYYVDPSARLVKYH